MLSLDFTNTNRVEIGPDTPFVEGDIIEMQFAALGSVEWSYFRALQYAIIEKTLKNKYPNFTILSSSNTETGFTMRFRVDSLPPADPYAIQQSSVVTAAIVAAAIIGGGIFTYLALDKVYRIVDSPAGQVALAGTGALAIGVLLLVMLIGLGLIHK